MKKLILAVLVIGFLMGCVTVSYPPQDSYWFDTYSGRFRICPKGMFNEENRGSSWWTENEVDKMYDDYIKSLEKEMPKQQI